MAYLCASIPPLRCYLRREYLFNLKEGHGEFVECTWIGLSSFQGRALGFRIITSEGVMFNNLPINAFVSDPKFMDQGMWKFEVNVLQLWDCFSYHFSVHQIRWAIHKTCRVILKNRDVVDAEYLFTVSWCDPLGESLGYSEDTDAKDAHILHVPILGFYVAQPNNRIIWNDLEFVTKPLDLSKDNPGYQVLDHKFVCENSGKWLVEDSSDYFYKMFRDTQQVEEKRSD